MTWQLGTGPSALPTTRPRSRIALPGASSLVLGERTLVMGIINVTPDSFADGGLRFDPARAVDAGWQMLEDGADMLDVGGESTRPGAEPVDAAEELRRVLPVLEAFAGRPLVSIDTYKAVVAREAIARGAAIVNDVSALHYDRDLADVVAESGAAVVLMHNRGRSREMYREAVYDDAARGDSRRAPALHRCGGRRRHQPRQGHRRPRARFREEGAALVSGARRPRSHRGAGPSHPRRTFTQVVSARRHRRRASGRAGLGDRGGRRRQRAAGSAHRQGPRGARDGPGRQGRRRHSRRPIVSGSLVRPALQCRIGAT